jgi:glucosamine-6-phosphate deaminase
MKEIQKDKLKIEVYENVDEMGKAAAISVAGLLQKATQEKGFANLILATGASQFSFLENLQMQKIEWNKITVFHLDEYRGMPVTHPASFRKYLKERILDKVQPKKVYYLEGDAADVDAAVTAYEALLKAPRSRACRCSSRISCRSR